MGFFFVKITLVVLKVKNTYYSQSMTVVGVHKRAINEL